MNKTIQLFITALTLSFAGLSGGCATQQEKDPRTLYDLGSLPATQNVAPALPPLSIAEVNAPQWLNSRMMFFRLAYANDQQPHPYANSRWSMPPAQLFGQRLKARLAQAGGAVLSASDGVANVPVLRVEADEFMQIFTSPGQSVVRVNVRASVLNLRTLAAHRNFMREVAAPTPDAAGGASALAEATDAIITDMMNWLAGLPLKK
ncbi:MAG: ABC transporter [Burkholderiales bacterium RIFCSPLOWO2_02_FULL_57_36]|nr:MAG: ABC transporter [Burkholderiales bacterium RIFCSPLOWO2_02_FULL_57_36]